MKTRSLSLATLLLNLGIAMTSGFAGEAATLDQNRLMDHLALQIPPHYTVISNEVSLIGNPVQAARLGLTVMPLENLYREVAQEAPIPSVEVILPDQLLQTRPSIRILKLASQHSLPLRPIRADIGVANQGGVWTFGTIPTRFFENAGLPRGLCTPGLATEDSPEGRAQLADFNRRSVIFEESVRKFCKGAKLDKAGKLIQNMTKTGMDIAAPFIGGTPSGASAGSNGQNAVKEVLKVIATPEAPSQVSTPPTSEAKPAQTSSPRLNLQPSPSKTWQISTNKLNRATKIIFAISQNQ